MSSTVSCSSPTSENGDESSPTCFDASGDVIATEGLRVMEPWVVLCSKKFEGRYFFLNIETNETAWTLNRSIIFSVPNDNDMFLESMDLDHQSHGNRNNDEIAPPPPSEPLEAEDATSSSFLPRTPIHNRRAATEEDDDEDKRLNKKLGLSSSSSSSSKLNLPLLKNFGVGGSFDSLMSRSSIVSPSFLRKRHNPKLSGWTIAPFPEEPIEPGSGSSIMALDITNEQSSSPSSPPMYRVLDGLGQGGYATVVKVEHLLNKKTFAMKVITKNISDDPKKRLDHKEQLQNELKFMTELPYNPFVQRCHCAFESPSSVYFILDLYSGGDLFYHLVTKSQSNESFHEKEVKIILAELFLALEHLHFYNIIHRDVKIENIMLDGNGHVKLIDFGLSKQLSSPIEKMSPAGSLIYMSPELILENTGGRHTDWWAYGVMAFELLTGRTPWSSLTNPQIIKHEIETVNVNKFLTDFSPQVSSFICSLMNINFMERLGTRIDSDIMNDPFFTSIDWEATKLQETEPALYPDHICTSEEARHSSLELYHKISSPQQNDQGGERSWNMGLEHSDNYLV